ncbi:MAG: hypothetical protein LBC82_01255 [Oscillospiraceae bacterium]|jgi:hypothetical protein|nr:hypothetical protein [Oscillospiraceae bacterium]
MINRIHINGEPSPCVLLQGWSVDQKINTPAEFICKVLNIDYDGNHIDLKLRNGYKIELYSGNQKLFGGILKTPEVEQYSGNILQYSLAASDFSELAYRRYIAASIIDTTVGAIIRERILPLLAEDGVTAGEIVEAQELRKANFNWIYCGEALNYLHNITGCNWWIDCEKRLHFVPNSMILSPWALSDDVQHSGFKHTLEHEQYRNIQYMQCGMTRTSIQQWEVLTPPPTGERRIFFSRYPVAQIMALEVFVNGAWTEITPDNIGIEGLNERGTRHWYYTFGSKTISQDDKLIPLTATQSIRITYTGLVRIFVRMENFTEITKRAEIEGSSGKYERLDIKPGIDNRQQAIEHGNSLINKFGEIEDRISFNTEVSGLAAGQLLTVNKPDFDIGNQTFLIETVEIKPAGSNGFAYSVRAIDGISVGGWETYFAGLITDKNEILIDETVTLFLDISDTSSLTSSTTIRFSRVLFPSDILFPSETLIPNESTSQEVILNE